MGEAALQTLAACKALEQKRCKHGAIALQHALAGVRARLQ